MLHAYESEDLPTTRTTRAFEGKAIGCFHRRAMRLIGVLFGIRSFMESLTLVFLADSSCRFRAFYPVHCSP